MAVFHEVLFNGIKIIPGDIFKILVLLFKNDVSSKSLVSQPFDFSKEILCLITKKKFFQ